MEDLYNKASLVLTPQMVETGKVYSMKPEDRKGDFTFSRSTYATRVGPTGLIEKETQNLLLQSNQFDTTWTTTSSITLTSGQSGYDGTNNAWLLERIGTGGQRLFQNISSSGVRTFSVYAKANVGDWLLLYGIDSSAFQQWFNLTTGTIGNGGPNNIDAKIESIGNGWYRCSVSFNISIADVRIYSVDGNGSVLGTNESVYIQDAQLEQGLVARDYIETTTTAIYGGITDNVPRLDYTDSSCPALLLEPQRTNILPHSEYFEGYGKGSVTITTNYGISPEGIKNSTRLQFSGSGYIATSVTTYANEVSSIYVKGASGDTIRFGKGPNVATGQAYTLTGNWQRLVFDTGSASSTWFISNYSATATEVEVYGGQHEEGSYATSYIPTYGSAVTRNKEQSLTTLPVSTGNGWSVLMDWTDANFQLSGYGNALFRMEMKDSSDVFALLGQGYTGQNRTRAYYNGYFGSLIDFPLGEAKVGFTADGSTIKTFVNGSLYNTNTIAHNTDFDYIRLNADAGTNAYNKLLLFQSKLTDQEMIDLTTL